MKTKDIIEILNKYKSNVKPLHNEGIIDAMDFHKVANEIMEKINKEAEKVRSASDFKEEIIKKLTAFYAYGDEYGYSNSELSRIRSCITKVQETSV